MNPLLPVEYIVIIFGATILAAIYLSWESASLAPDAIKFICTTLRFLTILFLAVIAFDPGDWESEARHTDSVLAVMLDNSSSMRVQDFGKSTRIEAAAKLAGSVMEKYPGARIYPFSSNAAPALSSADKLKEIVADGGGTDIVASGNQILLRHSAGREQLSGIIIISDGSETRPPGDTQFPILARARNIPIFAVCIGGEIKKTDIVMELPQRNYTVFPGQTQIIAPSVTNVNMGDIKIAARLVDRHGTVLQQQEFILGDNARQSLSFSVAPETTGSHEFRLEIPGIEDSEQGKSVSFSVNVTDKRLKILLIEGRPYWDSKFLSQSIQKNSNMELTGIYRLSPDRFFMVVQSDGNAARESETAIFPETASELSSYSLIIFGRGAEFFIDEQRMALLKSYIRDFGGAVLMSRGKPYSGESSPLADIEPAYWGDAIEDTFHWKPSIFGTASRLFGDLLPSANDPIWDDLPPVEKAFRCSELKSFTEILMSATGEKTRTEIPVIMKRKYGKGVVLAVNSEDLWRWDFFPLAGETAEFYSNFWGQLAFWAVKHSEFLPNEDYSLLLNKNYAAAQEEVICQINTRKHHDSSDDLKIKVARNNQVVSEIVPAMAERNSLRAVFSVADPGEYTVSLLKGGQALNSVSAVLLVREPLGENGKLSADPENLRQISEHAGGRMLLPDELLDALSMADAKPESQVDENKRWKSSWPKHWALVLIAIFLSAECFLRRRNGLL